MDLTTSWIGVAAILIFCTGYALVVSEEFTQLRKSKAMILAAGLIWSLIALEYVRHGSPHLVEEAGTEFLAEVSL